MPCHLLIIPKGNNIYNAAQYPNNEALKRSILSTVSFLSQRIKNCGLKGNIIVFENGSTSDNNLCRLPWEPDDICNNGIHLHIGFIPSNALTLDLDNRISFNGTSINQPFRKILTLLYKLVSPIPENIRIHSYTNDQSLFSTLPFGLEPYWNAMVFNSGEIQEVTIQNTGGRGKPSMLMRDIITRIIFDPEHELIRTEIYNYKKTAIRSITKLREYESIDPLLLISAEFIKLFFDILKYD